MSSTAVGLDIGSTALRGVELRSNGKSKPSLLHYHSVPLPVGAVTRGEITMPIIVAAAMKKLWAEGKFSSKNVILGTGNQKTLVRDLSLPKTSLKHIRETLPFHVHNTLQMPMDGSLFDFYPVSESDGDHGMQVNGLLVVAEKNSILTNINIAEKAGLNPVEVDLTPFALNRILMNGTLASGVTAVIDIGGATTTVVIAQDGTPLFVRIIPLGGNDLTVALKNNLEISEEEAESLKRTLHVRRNFESDLDITGNTSECSCSKCASEITLAEDSRTLEIVRVVTNEMFTSLRNTIDYFDNSHISTPVSSIQLTGGAGELLGFAEALSEVVVLPVSRPDPFTNIVLSRRAKSKKEKRCGTYSVALGLALRSFS